MNFATRALLPLLSISLNDGEGGGSGGGGDDGGGGAGGSSGDGKGAGSNAGEGQAEGDKKPDANAAAGDDAAKKAAADATAALTKSYDGFKFKLPEPLGQLDDATTGALTKAFIENGVKPEAAQKLADVFGGAEVARLKAVAEGLKSERMGWDKTVRADKELAGEKGELLEQTAAAGRKAMNKFATPEFRKLLASSGLEAHPEMLRVMARIGKTLAEDKTDTSRSGAGGKKDLSPKDKLKARYDHPSSAELFNAEN